MVSHQAVRWAMRDAPMLRTSAGKPYTTARLVLVALAESAGKVKDGKLVTGTEFESAHPSVFTLSYRTGLCERAITDALKALRAAELITQVGVIGDNVAIWTLNASARRPDADLIGMQGGRDAAKAKEAARWHKRKPSRNLVPEGPSPLQESGSGVTADSRNQILVLQESGSGAPEPNADVVVQEKSRRRKTRGTLPLDPLRQDQAQAPGLTDQPLADEETGPSTNSSWDGDHRPRAKQNGHPARKTLPAKEPT